MITKAAVSIESIGPKDVRWQFVLFAAEKWPNSTEEENGLQALACRPLNLYRNLARPAGFEPTTPWFVAKHRQPHGYKIKDLERPRSTVLPRSASECRQKSRKSPAARVTGEPNGRCCSSRSENEPMCLI